MREAFLRAWRRLRDWISGLRGKLPRVPASARRRVSAPALERLEAARRRYWLGDESAKAEILSLLESLRGASSSAGSDEGAKGGECTPGRQG